MNAAKEKLEIVSGAAPPPFRIFAGGIPRRRRRRNAFGLSLEYCTRIKLSDVANNTIIKIEAGKNQNPTLDTLKKIAKALEVSVDDLIK